MVQNISHLLPVITRSLLNPRQHSVSTDIRAGAKGCAYMKLLSELSFI